MINSIANSLVGGQCMCAVSYPDIRQRRKELSFFPSPKCLGTRLMYAAVHITVYAGCGVLSIG